MKKKLGFIGLGNVGLKLATSLAENKFPLTIHDLNMESAEPLMKQGATWATSPENLAKEVEIIFTCLPSPTAVSKVVEGEKGILKSLSKEKIWVDMSTTDNNETQRLAKLVKEKGAEVVEAPVSGGCHRAATGNIAIFAGGERKAFDEVLPALSAMGKHILHVGPLGTASVLKVVTNFLASTHLVAVGEALMACKKTGINLNTAFEGIRISSGNSFVHETESQVIMNGSYNINFTMDLVCKDVGLFKKIVDRLAIPTEIAPLLVNIFEDGRKRYGDRAWSSMIVKRIEDACNTDLRAPGFPKEIVDHTPRNLGSEIKITNNI